MLEDGDGAAHAMLAAQESRTHQRPEKKSILNGAELTHFGEVSWAVTFPVG